MEALSVREYRNNLAASFDKAAEGESVIIKRKNKLYALVSLGKEQVNALNQQKEYDELSASIRRSWQQVKEIENGALNPKSAMSFLDEL